LFYEDNKRYLTSKTGIKLTIVQSEGDVLVVRVELSRALANALLVCHVVDSQEHVSDSAHSDTLYNWHRRLGHQSYDAIETLAAKPGSDIKLTDHSRPKSMTCAEGKQTKNKQSK
jgi:hypothetical protein